MCAYLFVFNTQTDYRVGETTGGVFARNLISDSRGRTCIYRVIRGTYTRRAVFCRYSTTEFCWFYFIIFFFIFFFSYTYDSSRGRRKHYGDISNEILYVSVKVGVFGKNLRLTVLIVFNILLEILSLRHSFIFFLFFASIVDLVIFNFLFLVYRRIFLINKTYYRVCFLCVTFV